LDRIGSLTALSKLHIQAAIKSAAGQKSSLVTAFEKLAKKDIGLLKEPSLNCVRFVVGLKTSQPEINKKSVK
jgi:hypothetical protein